MNTETITLNLAQISLKLEYLQTVKSFKYMDTKTHGFAIQLKEIFVWLFV